MLPKTVEHAFKLDIENGNDFWRNSIEKELKTVCVAYKPYLKNDKDFTPEQIRADRKQHLVGYKDITCHFFFNIKLDGSFTRKALSLIHI